MRSNISSALCAMCLLWFVMSLSNSANAFDLTINGASTFMQPQSGPISTFTQVSPENVVVGAFSETAESHPVGVIGTFSAGSRRRANHIYFIELPEVLSSAEILSASASIQVNDRFDSPSWNIDMYVLGYLSAAVIDPAWRLYADTDPQPGVGILNRTKIQNNWITPSSPLNTDISTDASGDANLVTSLRSLYDAGAVGGDFVVVRLNPDAFLIPHTGGTDSYQIRLERPLPTPMECAGLSATILGTSGNDVLIGTSGDDVILGLEGDDLIIGKSGNDVVCAGAGNDLVKGGGGDDILFGNAGKDVLRGGAGTDTLNGGSGVDVINGGAGFDTLLGKNGDDRLFGDAGEDNLTGGEGDDILIGGADNDALTGNEGSDICDNSSGTDVLDSCDLTL